MQNSLSSNIFNNMSDDNKSSSLESSSLESSSLESSSTNLVAELKSLVGEERKIIAKIIDLLREVETRKTFLEYGYPSLYEFCTRELGYSEGSAHRRISAMRLIKSVPEVESKILNGEITLSVASMAQNYFSKMKKSKTEMSKSEKMSLLTQLENTSTRQCEKVLIKLDPINMRQDRETIISTELTEIRITVGAEFMSHLEKIKNFLSHSRPNLTTTEALMHAMDFYLKKKSLMGQQGEAQLCETQQSDANMIKSESKNNAQLPSAQRWANAKTAAIKTTKIKITETTKTGATKTTINTNTKSSTTKTKATTKAATSSAPATATATSSAPATTTSTATATSSAPATTTSTAIATAPATHSLRRTRYIPIQTRRAVWQKFNGQCHYVSPLTGQLCGSKKFLEIDHVFAFSMGGENSIDNLQLLCDAHNRAKG